MGAALLLATLLVRDPVFRETWRYSVQGVALFLLFNFALRSTGIVAAVLSSRPLKVVADYSYFLYLVHVPLIAASEQIPAPHPVRYAIAITIAFLLAALVRRFVELPLLTWRKRVAARLDVKVSVL